MTTNSEQSGDWVVTRRVPLAVPLDAGLLKQLVQLEDEQSGIQAVNGHAGATHLKVRYDATRTDYRSVCRSLAERGAASNNGRWPRLLAAWYGWLDANLRENAAAPGGACCNRPPQRRR